MRHTRIRINKLILHILSSMFYARGTWNVVCLPLLLLTLVWAATVTAQSNPQPLILTDAQGKYPLGRYLEILEDPSGQLTIEQVVSPEYGGQFVPNQEEVPNFGFTTSAYWVRFRVRNETNQTSQWLIALHDARVGYIDLYRPSAHGAEFTHKRAGRWLPFSAREISHHQFVFNLFLPPQTEQTIYLRFESQSTMVFPLSIWSLAAFAQDSQTELFFLGFFYGLLLIMIGYNFFLFLSLRDQSYLYLVLFIASFALNQASRDGLAQQYLWPSWPNYFGIDLFGILLTFFALKFTSVFLTTKVRVPRLHKVISLLMAIAVLITFLIPFGSLALITLDILVLLGALIILITGFIVWRQGYRPAGYYLIAWLSPVGGSTIFILTAFNLLPSNTLTENGSLLGVAMLVLLASLALADRINLFKVETEQANRNLVQSEQRLSQFLDALPVGVIIIDAAQKLHYVNQKVMQMFAGPNDTDLPDGTWNEILAERVSLYVAGSRQPYPFEHRPLTVALRGASVTANDIEVEQNGQRVPLEVWSRPILDEQGQVQFAISVFQDITERKQAEAELQQYKERLEEQVTARTAQLTAANEKLSQEIAERAQTEDTLAKTLALIEQAKREWEISVDSLPQFICLLDRQGLVLRTNRTVERWNLASVTAVKGLTLLNVLDLNGSPSSDLENLWKATWETLQTGQPDEFEFRHPSLGRYLYLQAQPITSQKIDKVEEHTFAVVVVQDVTERKRAETALRESEERFRDLAEATFEGIVIHDKGLILEANQAYATMFGYEYSEIVGRSTLDFVAPESQETVRQKIATGSEESYEAIGLKKDGTTFIHEVRGKPFLYLGKKVRVAAIHDITKRKQTEIALKNSEERLRHIFSSISDHIYVTEITPEGQRVNRYLSPTEALTGYPVEKFSEDWSFWPTTVIHPDDRALAAKQAKRLAKGQDSEVEYRLVQASGNVIWVRDNGRVEKDPTTGNLVVYGVISDITERKQAAEAEAQRARLNAFSADVGFALTQEKTLSAMLQACAQAMVNHLDAALARIWIFNEEEALLVLQASAGLYTHLDGGHSRIPITEQKICLASTVGEAFITNEVGRDPRVDQKDWLEQQGIVSLISYPLAVEQQLVGVVAMFGRHPFNQNVVEAMEVVTNTISLSIDRKQTEQSLHFQKTLLESQMEAAPDGILVVDTDRQQWLAVNQKYIEMWGIPENVHRSMSSEKAFQFILEHLVEPQEFVDKINILYKDKETKGRDEILLKDGRIFDRHTRPVTSADGIYYGRVWFYRDITMRKQAELEIAHLFEKQKRTEKSLRNVNQQMHQRVEELAALNHITQAVATVTDFQKLLEIVSRAITNLFDAFSTGISLFNEARTERTIVAMHQVRGTENLDLVGKVRLIADDTIYLEYINQGKSLIIPSPQTNPLITTTRQAITERNLQCLMLVPLQARGDVIGTIAISTDQPGREFTHKELKLAETISGQLAGAVETARLFSAMQQEIAERKRAQEKLAIARDQALEASHFKTQLLAKVSHELRTPLSAILGFTEMLGEEVYGPISNEQKVVTADIIDSTKFLTTLVNELLDQAQLEAGKLKLKSGVFSPANLLEQVETSMRIAAKNKGLKLLTQIDSNVPTALQGDPDRVQQILINLVNNAIKFTEHGQVEIKFYCSEDKQWYMQVSDTGPGIPPDIQANIFEPFRQMDDTITRRHRGYGLGLSIVKQLAELMGGQVTVISSLGQGSTFIVQLPLLLPEAKTS